MWGKMRQTVIDNFPEPAAVPTNITELLKQLDDKYTEDAYHSLSIEGYKVSDELIEKHPAVRAILGHFLFGFIHPYNDGNGRMSRFVMNVMLSTGGYSWTIIPVEKRDTYMQALEKASIEGDIADFTKLIADLLP